MLFIDDRYLPLLTSALHGFAISCRDDSGASTVRENWCIQELAGCAVGSSRRVLGERLQRQPPARDSKSYLKWWARRVTGYMVRQSKNRLLLGFKFQSFRRNRMEILVICKEPLGLELLGVLFIPRYRLDTLSAPIIRPSKWICHTYVAVFVVSFDDFCAAERNAIFLKMSLMSMISPRLATGNHSLGIVGVWGYDVIGHR